MKVLLDSDKYVIMKYVSQQAEEFRFAEMYHLLKKQDSRKWEAKEVKIALEWLANMGLIKGKTVKVKPGQAWLFYQPCFDHDYLLSRIKPEDGGNRTGTRVYICKEIIEKLRYRYACIMERYIRASWDLPYKSLFIIAEMEFVTPMTPGRKTAFKEKIEELDK